MISRSESRHRSCGNRDQLQIDAWKLSRNLIIDWVRPKVGVVMGITRRRVAQLLSGVLALGGSRGGGAAARGRPIGIIGVPRMHIHRVARLRER
jgi:hypothetical protein